MIKKDKKELFLAQKFQELQKSGKAQIEIAREMSRLRSELSGVVPIVTDQEYLREIYYRYFVTNRLNELKRNGMCDEELETNRKAYEGFVNKLMTMTSFERQQEFARQDTENRESIKNHNEQVEFDYLLTREVAEKSRIGNWSIEDRQAFIQEKKIEYIIGAFDYSEEEKREAYAALVLQDKKNGTSKIIDPDSIPTTNEKLIFLKNQMDLERIKTLSKK